MTNRRKPTRKRPKLVRRPTCHPATLPTEAGYYFWSEWNEVVIVYRKGRALWVKPPGAGSVPVKVTPYIAGNFRSFNK